MDFDDWRTLGINQGHFKTYLKERDSKMQEAKEILKSSLNKSMETTLRKIYLRLTFIIICLNIEVDAIQMQSITFSLNCSS